MSFFVDPSTIRENSSDLTKIDCTDSSKHLSNDQIFVGNDTLALITHSENNDRVPVSNFFQSLVEFYERFVTKQLKLFDFKSQHLYALTFLDPAKTLRMPTSVFDVIEENFPIDFNKAIIKLEHREFVCDGEVCPNDTIDAISFWVEVSNLKSPMGSLKPFHCQH